MNIQKFTTFKTILIALVLTINANHLFSQTTNGIFFQAVARDNFSNPAKDRKIYVQSSIIQTTPTGTKVLTEEHQANTDATGVFSISLGNGVRVGGTASSLTTIDWSKGPFYLNLKVAITPIGGNSNWDYSKEWVDMGTTSFGAVPFALYSASSAKVDDKLNVSDTTTMLKVYAKAIKVQSLETAVASKLTAADTLTMLAPYAKAAYTIDSSFFKSQLATKLSIADTIYYTKQKYTDSAIAKKLNISDTINYTKQKFTDSAFSKKLNIADSAIYVTKSQLASYNFSTGRGGVTLDTTSLSNRINLKANATEIINLTSSLGTKLSIADSTKYITPTQLAAKTFDTTSLSSRINLKANTTDVTNAINAEATAARAAELVLTNNITSNTASITANTTAISNLNSLNTTIAANTTSITSLTTYLFDQVASLSSTDLTITNNLNANTAAINSLNTNIASHTSSITANAVAITAEATTARAAELVLTNNITANTASITANTVSIGNLNSSVTSNITNTASNTTAIGNLNTSMAANTTNIATNTSAIAAEATTARAAELILTNNVASNTSSITTLNTIITAATNSNTANTLVKRDASGDFSAGTITANLTGNVTGSLTGNATTATTASSISGTVTIANGGTNATTASAALSNLGAASIGANLNDQTGTTYTLQSSDNGKVVTLSNASAITVTVPAGLVSGFNCMIVQKGVGVVTLSPANTVTVTNRSGGTKTGGQNAIVTIISIVSNYFITGGDMQ